MSSTQELHGIFTTVCHESTTSQLVNACLILTVTLPPFSVSCFFPSLLCLQNMKGTCCRCCLTSATSPSYSSLNVFLQDHKSPLSSLVWVCSCVCWRRCAAVGVRVLAHMHAWLMKIAQWLSNGICVQFNWQIRGQRVQKRNKSLVQLGSYLKDNFLFVLTNVFFEGQMCPLPRCWVKTGGIMCWTVFKQVTTSRAEKSGQPCTRAQTAVPFMATWSCYVKMPNITVLQKVW